MYTNASSGCCINVLVKLKKRLGLHSSSLKKCKPMHTRVLPLD